LMFSREKQRKASKQTRRLELTFAIWLVTKAGRRRMQASELTQIMRPNMKRPSASRCLSFALREMRLLPLELSEQARESLEASEPPLVLSLARIPAASRSIGRLAAKRRLHESTSTPSFVS